MQVAPMVRWLWRRRALLLALVLVGGSWTVPTQVLAQVAAPANPPRPDFRHSYIASYVGLQLKTLHFAKRPIDDTISERLFEQYLKAFDPIKQYFLQSDVAEFDKYRLLLDNHLEKGDLLFAFNVFDRYTQRLNERVKWINEILTEEFDFTVPAEVVLEADEKTTYAATAEDSKERWRQRIKYQMLLLKLDNKTDAEARERLEKRYRSIKNRWQRVQSEEILEIYLTALTNSFDPHSTYMSPMTLENFQIDIKASLDGIGALLREEDGSISIVEVVPGGAAAKDGRIKPGDRIVGVGEGPEGEIQSVEEQPLNDVVKKIRGQAGTVVRLEVIPVDTPEHKIYNLIRDKVRLQDRQASGTMIDWPIDGQSKIKLGVIDLPSFYADNEGFDANEVDSSSATNDVRRLLNEFQQQGAQAVVLDLRGNGGGLLGEAIGLTGLFIDEGPVVQVKGAEDAPTPYMDRIPGVAYSGPLVVLINKFSASASEIFAGAIQDYGRGIVVGDSSTHGKGSVQQVFDLGALGAIKLTRQMFYRVNGDSTQSRGVLADVLLPSTSDSIRYAEASLDHALEFLRTSPAPHKSYSGLVNSQIVQQLRAHSSQRLKQDEALRHLLERVQKLNQLRDRKNLTFTEASLRQEREDIKKLQTPEERAEDEAETEETPTATPAKKEFGKTPYDKEVLAITADYLRLLEESKVTKR